MISSAPTANTERPLHSDTPLLWPLLGFALATTIFIFRDSLLLMVKLWDSPEYSHGYMIPVVALLLLWQRVNQLPATVERGSWWGSGLLLIGLAGFVIGELSAIYTVIQYAFLLSIAGIALSFFGTRGMRLLWIVLAYLIFMIPLPNFLYFNLSSQMQLLSSQIGVAVIRLFGISVFVEGNVIDLGSMQLQVAEACSGLRYLFPLMSFGFLIAYLYRGPFWQRVVLFLSTIPITIGMNSFRIGVIGVTVDKWGIQMAQGFLHDFEGWVVFMGCVGVLCLEIFCFHLLRRDNVAMLDRLNLDMPPLKIKLSDFPISYAKQRPFIYCVMLLIIATPLLTTIDQREEKIPDRSEFSQFPLLHKDWIGKRLSLDSDVLNTLKLSDYIQADFRNTGDNSPINFYTAWYGSQKKGASIHSPRSCIPGGGWRIQSLDQRDINNIQHVSGSILRVNRALIQKGDSVQVVYYWFEGRNRNITNEYLAKWYVFWDSLWQQRSDGALVRVVAFVPDASQVGLADARIEKFLRDFYPLMSRYVP